MACLLHGLSRGGGERPSGQRHAAGNGGYKDERPAFLAGPPPPAQKDLDPGPSMAFHNIMPDPDEVACPLERRLYHSAPPRKQAPPPPASPAPRTPSVRPAPAPPPSSGGARTKGRQTRGKGGTRDQLPYPSSPASSMASGWRKTYQQDAPPSLLSRGLTSNDISRSQECSPGVCVMRQMSLPNLPPNEDAALAIRSRQTELALQRAYEFDARCRENFARPGSAANSASGNSAEVLPKQQRFTVGRPSLCRPIPADMSPEKRKAYFVANDSLDASEHRAKYWWKESPPFQKKELKKHVRPMDSWNHFRDTAVKQKDSLSYPICTY